MSNIDKSIALNNASHLERDVLKGLGSVFAGIGLFMMIIGWFGNDFVAPQKLLYPSLILLLGGMILYGVRMYYGKQPGIKNDGVFFKDLTTKGIKAWLLAVVLTGFYILLYWFPEILGMAREGKANTGLVAMFDPLSIVLNGKPASQWFVYGTLYTIFILGLGVKFILKYRHNRYHTIRTISIMIFQLGFAWLIPEILSKMNSGLPYFAKDIKNMWPLNYYFFNDWHIKNMLNGGSLGMFFLVLGLLMIFVISPVLTYYFGKRWYCSWVCGCGGLAETAGDSFRHLSDTSLKAWKIERWMIHSVLVLAIIMTGASLYGYFSGQSTIMGLEIYKYFQKPYGFLIGAAFSGVVGVGFYPLLGSRVWCRYGCPMAGILGLQQRFFSRFRITTNGDQCISCGNCTTYCEMGIDVRSYAQKGQNIVRASCVGCGICASVCPRGVLRLENGSIDIMKRTD